MMVLIFERRRVVQSVHIHFSLLRLVVDLDGGQLTLVFVLNRALVIFIAVRELHVDIRMRQISVVCWRHRFETVI